MLCEECNEREATYTVSVMMGDETTTRHLCAECMSRMNANIAAGNIKTLLSSILSAITGSPAENEATPEDNSTACERCGTTLSQFRKSGRLGCPGCYQAFREQLQPMLLQIHGRVQHAGRRPLPSEEEQQVRSRHDELTQQLAQAVAMEDFETAAVLRDQLRAMNASEEAKDHA